MPASKPLRELRRKAADLIIDRLKHPEPNQDRISVAKASEDLGISRQAVYDILNRRYCPSLSLIHRACEVWNLKFEFRGMVVEKETLRPPMQPPASGDVTQIPLDLPEAVRQISYRDFEVIEAKPAGRSIEITLRLTIPA